MRARRCGARPNLLGSLFARPARVLAILNSVFVLQSSIGNAERDGCASSFVRLYCVDTGLHSLANSVIIISSRC